MQFSLYAKADASRAGCIGSCQVGFEEEDGSPEPLWVVCLQCCGTLEEKDVPQAQMELPHSLCLLSLILLLDIELFTLSWALMPASPSCP